MNRINVICIAMLLFASCSENGNKTGATEEIITSKDYLVLGDTLISHSKAENKVAIYAKKDGQYVKVIDNKWPEGIETTYNVIEDSSMKVYIEVPYSESGDWNNTYTYYYDSKGNLRASKIVSTFFNSVCYDGALTEITIRTLDEDHKVLSNNYSLIDDKKNPIKDTSKCVFNYRDSVPLYITFKEIPLIQSEWK